MLNLSGLTEDEIKIIDVKVDEHDSEPITIRTLLCGQDDGKPKLVYCHGYGGSGALFFNLMKPLIQKFYVIFLDMPGQGASSR